MDVDDPIGGPPRAYHGDMPSWLPWVVVAAFCGVLEITTLALVFGLVAVAALVTAVVAGVGAGAALQLLVFSASSLALLLLVRPIAARHLRTPARLRTGVAALVGSRALAIEQVDGHRGLVKIGGEVWSARSYDETQVIEPGAPVDVVQIRGAVAVVMAADGWPS